MVELAYNAWRALIHGARRSKYLGVICANKSAWFAYKARKLRAYAFAHDSVVSRQWQGNPGLLFRFEAYFYHLALGVWGDAQRDPFGSLRRDFAFKVVGNVDRSLHLKMTYNVDRCQYEIKFEANAEFAYHSLLDDVRYEMCAGNAPARLSLIAMVRDATALVACSRHSFHQDGYSTLCGREFWKIFVPYYFLHLPLSISQAAYVAMMRQLVDRQTSHILAPFRSLTLQVMEHLFLIGTFEELDLDTRQPCASSAGDSANDVQRQFVVALLNKQSGHADGWRCFLIDTWCADRTYEKWNFLELAEPRQKRLGTLLRGFLATFEDVHRRQWKDIANSIYHGLLLTPAHEFEGWYTKARRMNAKQLVKTPLRWTATIHPVTLLKRPTAGMQLRSSGVSTAGNRRRTDVWDTSRTIALVRALHETVKTIGTSSTISWVQVHALAAARFFQQYHLAWARTKVQVRSKARNLFDLSDLTRVHDECEKWLEANGSHE